MKEAMYTDELEDVRTNRKMYGRVERCRNDKYARNGNFGLDTTYTMKFGILAANVIILLLQPGI